MSCFGCNSEITFKLSKDESILKLAKSMAKERNETIALFRNHEGRLCISTGDDPAHYFITPFLQNNIPINVH